MSVPTDEVQQTEAPKEPTFKDEMQKMYHNMIIGFIKERNDAVGRSNAASGDRVTLTEQIRENSTDPAIVEAREVWAQAYLNLMSLVDPLVEKIIADSQGSVDELEEKIKDIDGSLKPAKTLYKKLYGEDAMAFFPKEDRLKGATVRSGTGVRRIRGFNVVVTIDGEPKEFENFASAAKYLGWDTPDFQKAFFDKAGTTEQKSLPDEVKFTVNYTETDADNNEVEKEAFVKAYKTDVDSSDEASDDEENESEDEGTDESVSEDDLSSIV